MWKEKKTKKKNNIRSWKHGRRQPLMRHPETSERQRAKYTKFNNNYAYFKRQHHENIGITWWIHTQKPPTYPPTFTSFFLATTMTFDDKSSLRLITVKRTIFKKKKKFNRNGITGTSNWNTRAQVRERSTRYKRSIWCVLNILKLVLIFQATRRALESLSRPSSFWDF